MPFFVYFSNCILAFVTSSVHFYSYFVLLLLTLLEWVSVLQIGWVTFVITVLYLFIEFIWFFVWGSASFYDFAR